MHVELLQDMINVLAYAISSRGSTVEELLEMLNREFANDPYYPTGSEPVSEYPEEVKSAFGGANDGEMYDDYLRYLSGSVQRSSLDKQMENTMRITETKLRRVVRKVILEFGETDAQLRQKLANRDKMIGRGIDGGTIGFDPNWDYATNRPLKPKRMHRLVPELQPVANMIKNDFEELQLMPGRNGGPPDMFYFTMVGSGIRARCDHDSYNVQKNYPDFTGEGCFVAAVGPDAVKDGFEEGAETLDPADIKEVLENFIDWASNNIQEDSVWMTFAPAS